MRSRYGPYLKTRFADSTFWLAARYGNDEVMDLLADLQPDDGFVDVGANIGLTTCYAAPRCSAVLGLEASGRELIDLVGNCSLVSCCPPPLCLLTAAAEASDFLPFRVGNISHSGGSSIAPHVNSYIGNVSIVPSISLAELLNVQNLKGWPALAAAHQAKRLVVKIDVEGFEAMVLSGMSTLLKEKRCRKGIVEVNPGRASSLAQSLNVDEMMAEYASLPTIPSAGRAHFDQCYGPQA